MSALSWIGVVAAAWIALGVVVFCVREREAREALTGFFLALVVGPALVTVGVFLRAWAPRATPMTAKTLELFARRRRLSSDETGRRREAWALTYRGHGLIFVRRADGRTDHLNNVTGAVGRARHDAHRGMR